MASPHRIPAAREDAEDDRLAHGSSVPAELVVPMLFALIGAMRVGAAIVRGETWGAEVTIALLVALAASAMLLKAVFVRPS